MTLIKGNIYNFTVVEEVENSLAVIIKDEFNQTHYYPRKLHLKDVIRLKVMSIEDNGKHIFKELQDISKYELGHIYQFNVIEQITNRTGTILFKMIDPENNYITTIRAFDSQLPPNEVPSKISCKVDSIDKDKNKIILYQYDCTIFQDGVSYDFTYINQLPTDSNYINAKGIDGKIYSLISPFGIDKQELKDNDVIKYVCTFQKGRLAFRYFITFEDIIKYRILKQNTFESLKNSASAHATKLYKDFQSKNNLWILSFCSLLQEEYRSSIDNDEYEKALMYGEVLVNVEYWILNSGFLKSFKENLREKKEYAKGTYKKYRVYTKSLDILLSERFFQYIENLCTEINSASSIDSSLEEKIETVQYILKLLKEQINTPRVLAQFIDFIKILGRKNYFKEQNRDLQNFITYHIKNILILIEKENLSKIFLNSKAINSYYNNNNLIKQYLRILRLHILVLKDLKNVKEFNLNILKYIRTQSLFLEGVDLQKLYIKSALSFSTIEFDEEIIQDVLFWELEDTNFDSELMKNVKLITPVPIKKLTTIKNALNTNQEITSKVLGENRYGYIVDINGDKSILPTSWIADESDFELKTNPERKINVRVNRIDEDFGRIISSNNLKLYNISEQQNLEEGNIVEGIVKRFETYGAFIDLGSIDGLLRLSEMSYNFVSHPSEILKIGEVLNLKVLENKEEEGKIYIFLSLKELKEKPSDVILYDTDYLARVTRVTPNYLFATIIETGEQGIIFKDQATWSHITKIEEFYKSGDKITVRLKNREDKGLVFSIKESMHNPFYHNTPSQKIYDGNIASIENDSVIVKCLEMGQYVKYIVKNESELLLINEFDSLKFSIEKTNNKTREIYINIDFSSINKNSIEYFSDSIDVKINEEIGKCYELYAMQSINIDSKHNYLSWAKYFFSLANSAKSYYLNFYITYQEIIKLSHIDISSNLNIDCLIENVIAKSEMLIQEIDSKDLTTKIFPLLEQLKITLEIICLFGESHEDALEYLLNIIQNEKSTEKINFQLAKIVLSYNLLASEINDPKLKKENWYIVHNILEEGLLDIDNLPIIDERTNNLLKLIKEDESRTLEFKSSLFTPIPDKDKRVLILNLEEELKLVRENDNGEKAEKIELKILELKNNNAQKAVIHTAMKTLVAFANSEGGDLIIGLEDNKNILGLNFDFNSLGDKKENLFDAFNLRFDKFVSEYIGLDFNLLLDNKAEFINIDDHYLYWVKVKKSKSPVYLKKDDKGNIVSEVWVRAQASSNKVTKAEELQKFFKQFD